MSISIDFFTALKRYLTSMNNKHFILKISINNSFQNYIRIICDRCGNYVKCSELEFQPMLHSSY